MLSLRSSSVDPVPVAEPAPVAEERYTVLLLDESQLNRFLGRPSMKSIDRRTSSTIDVWPVARSRRTWMAGGVIGALAVWALVWMRASAGGGDEVKPIVTEQLPTVATAASFSVTVASFVNDAEARALATRLEKLGLPAFAWRIDGTKRQVLLGPYVSIDEADAAQRALAGHGYRRTPLYVDERLRTTAIVPAGYPPAVQAASGTSSGLVLVAAPGRLSLVFELPEEPREVSGNRVGRTSFEVTAGPFLTAVRAEKWSAPADIQLVKQVIIDGADELGSLRARLVLSETALAAVRVLGRRVYVDISRANPELDDSPLLSVPAPPAALQARAARERAASPRGAAPTVTPAPSEDQYRQTITPVIARFEEIQPFLRSAVTSPSPEVLAALGGTFGELEQSMRAADVPRESLASHGLLTSAVQLAKSAVAPDFHGDRVAQAREAAAQFAAAKVRFRN